MFHDSETAKPSCLSNVTKMFNLVPYENSAKPASILLSPEGPKSFCSLRHGSSFSKFTAEWALRWTFAPVLDTGSAL